MTDKITLTQIQSGYELSKINDNFQKIEDELNDKVLYRNPPTNTTNTLEKTLDANNQKIVNLPVPTENYQAVPKKYVDDAVFSSAGIIQDIFMFRANNLSDVSDPVAARSNLGLGSASIQPSSAFEPADATILKSANIGVSVQGYDANTAKTNVAQNFTVPQRSALLVDNDGSFNLSAKQNFKCTTSGAVTITFTNQQDGLSGSVIFVNAANHVVSAHANTKITTSDLSKINASGTYRIDYLSDGTNAYCSVVGAFA